LVLFLFSSGVYLPLTAGRFASYYRPRGYRGYFLHQLCVLTVMAYAARSIGPVWFLFLPASSQAVLFLPVRKMAVTLAA